VNAKLRFSLEEYSDHSVIDRVTVATPTASSFKGCAAGKSSGFQIPSHALQFVTRLVSAFLSTNWSHGNGVRYSTPR